MAFEKQDSCTTTSENSISIPAFGEKTAKKLLERLEGIRLYAHSYAFILNYTHGNFTPIELLDFANDKNLYGIMINIDDGGENSLANMSLEELDRTRSHACKLGLSVHIEVSSTTQKDVDSAARIAKMLEIENIRLYSRNHGRLSEIIEKTVDDLRYVSELADSNKLLFVLEQHELLKSHELVEIIKKVGNPRIGMLFDFSNMLNANEQPLDALETMSPFIQQVHLKDVRKIVTGKGCGQLGVEHGKGDLPLVEMIFKLLMLGDTEAQVTAFGLEQVVGFESPPYRFHGEINDQTFTVRERSRTRLDANYTLEKNLAKEKEYSNEQISYINNLLLELKKHAELVIHLS